MFDNFNGNGSNRTNNTAITSGYNVERGLRQSGIGKVKEQFRESLTLQPGDATEETVLRYAQMSGELKGYNALLKRASRQKLDTARSALQTYNTLLQHAQQSASLEAMYQQTTARNAQQLAEKQLDMKINAVQHNGFTRYMQQADDIIQY